jgi:hypothetical protein
VTVLLPGGKRYRCRNRRATRDAEQTAPSVGGLAGNVSGLPLYAGVVRRGENVTFAQFAAVVNRVVWDRRFTERRVSQMPTPGKDRRRAERRRPPPETWTTKGYLIAQVV